MTDEELMDAFREGDAQAFDALFSRYAPLVRSYLRRMAGGDSAHADDLLQATFLSVVRARGRFSRGARFKPWLYAIATNAARDAHRRGKSEALTDDGTVPEQEAEPVALKDPGLERQVQKALAQLPAAQREAIVLHRFEGLSFAEVAQVVGLTESAVKVRAHRGYEALRGLLKGVWEP